MRTGMAFVHCSFLALIMVVLGACDRGSPTPPSNALALAETIAAGQPQVAARVSPRAAGNGLEQDPRGGARSTTWSAIAHAASGMSLGACIPSDARGAFLLGLATRAEGAAPDARGEYVVQVVHADVANAPLVVDRGRAVYAGIARDTDLIFTTSEDRVEWFYTLKTSRAPTSFRLDVALPAGLPKVKSDGTGALAFLDQRGNTRLRMPRPFALDAHGKRREATLTWDGKSVHLDVSTEGLVYPVLLDPAVVHGDWEQVGNATPAARNGAMMAYDRARGRIVLFGGGDGLDDTWEWDGTTWLRRVVSTSPSARSGAGMAYDSARGKTVLFGGASPAGAVLDDTWEWDGTTWTLRTVSTSPSARNVATMAYDSARGKTVLFGGGDSGGNPLGQTWEWDGTTWTLRTPSTSPPVRVFATMAYDSGRGKTVLFGGDTVNAGLDDTWEWDGTTWTLRTPSASPPMRILGSMVYDTVRGKTVLFGGNFSGLLNDTWEWDGTTWTLRTVITSPSGREDASMAYDSARGKTVLFGGDNSNGNLTFSDTWEWDGTTWTIRTVSGSAPARNQAAMDYDSARGKTVLFGGIGFTSLLNDTWEWDGTTWTFRSVSTSPPARNFSSMAYDSARSKSVLFGGYSGNVAFNDTWEWDGTTWTLRTVSTSPSARGYAAMSYDSARGKTVLFGGIAGNTYLGDTWEWNGTTWTLRTVSPSPTIRFGAMMAYDSARAKTVLFGGNTSGDSTNAQTWEWDGTTWTLRTVSASPPGRYQGTMAYDSARGRTIVFGGAGAGALLNDTWEWDGTTWMIRATGASPIPRQFTTIAYDSARGRTVLFGGDSGVNGVGPLGDTWEFHTYGDACSSPLQCDTGFCVDGVCCQTFQCGTCQSCSLSGSEGTCSLVPAGAQDLDSCVSPNACSATGLCGIAQGASCTSNANCQTGFCTDGVCCDSLCNGDCQACAQSKGAAADGFCAIAPLGTTPRTNTCGIYECSGASPSCTTQCTGDLGCTSGYYCAAGGTCVPSKAQGAACDDGAGHDCLASGCRDCAVPLGAGNAASGQCVDGVCCNTACDGACDVCNAPGSLGTCTPAAAGAVGTPICAPALCDGTSQTCATTCAKDADCASGAICDAAAHACRGTSPPGTACGRDEACASDHCVDGVCCATTCAGQCEACNIPGSQGTCSPVQGAPRGVRAACGMMSDAGSDAGGTSSPCQVGVCDGVSTEQCKLPGATTVCRSTSCAGGTETFPAACDGTGNCGAIQTKPCTPYVCAGEACGTSCASDTDCDAQFTCAPGASARTCVPKTSASCDGDHTLVAPDGTKTDCAPYKCEGTMCKSNCASIIECAVPNECVASTQTCVAPTSVASTGSSGCSCRAAGDDGHGNLAGGGAMLAALVLGTRRKRAVLRRGRRALQMPR